MGLIDKFKNLFTEEIEEEVRPIKKEVRHVEIPSPKRSETPKGTEINSISDSNIITKEEKVITPVYFDDKDFDDLEKPKPKENVKEKAMMSRENTPKLYGGNKVEEKKVEPLTFRPSPIISPVYGVLDKNYTKHEVLPKRNETPKRRNSNKVTIDDVRNKAYGTLEDELKNSFFDDDYMYKEEKYENNKDEDYGTIDVLEELNLDEIDNYDEIKITDKKVNSLILDDLDLDDDTELLAKQLEEQNKKLEEINQMIDDEESSSRQGKEIDLLVDTKEEQANNVEEIEKIIDKPTDEHVMEEIIDEQVEEIHIKEDGIEEDIEKIIDEQLEEPVIEKENETKKLEIKKKNDKKNEDASLTESELLDLVDSMYDEKGE